MILARSDNVVLRGSVFSVVLTLISIESVSKPPNGSRGPVQKIVKVGGILPTVDLQSSGISLVVDSPDVARLYLPVYPILSC